MSVAPHAGVIDFGTFTPPTDSRDGIQGEVPKPLIGQQNYILTASGWAVAPTPVVGAYPPAGIPNSTGSAWGTSYGVTGTGSVVLSTSPTLVTPVLGTPTSATLTNATGLPLTTGVTGTLPVLNGGTGRDVGNYSVYANEIHVGKNGNDTTGDGTLINPVLTITKALTLIGGGINTVIVHPGSYSESPTVVSANTTITTSELTGANTQITGTLTLSAAARVSGIKLTNLTITGSGNIYISNCTVDTRVIKSGSNYVEIINSELQCVSGIQITGAGTVSIIGNKCWAVAVSNASASVLIKDCYQVITPSVTAGTLQIDGSAIFAESPTSNAITSSAGSFITLANSYILNSAANNVERISLAGSYSILNLVYDKTNSTFAGTSLNAIDYFQRINLDNITSTVYTVATLPSASTYGKGTCAFVSNALSPRAGNIVQDGGGSGTPTPVFSNGTNWICGTGLGETTGTGSVVLSNAPSLTGGVTIGNATDTAAITLGKSEDSQTVNIATGIVFDTKTKTINIGTNGDAGSLTNITIGSVGGASTTTFNGNNVLSGTLSGSFSGNVSATGLSASSTINLGGETGAGVTQNLATNQTAGTFNFLTGQTSAILNIGGTTSATGAITLGQSTSNQTVNINHGSSAVAKTINIGRNGTAGTTTVNIGTLSGGTNTITLGGGTGTGTITINNTTGASSTSLSTGITASGSTKTVNIGTNGALGSTTNINIGSATTGATNNITFNADATINTIKVGKGGGVIATNTAVGSQTLNANTTGSSNTSIGYQSLNANSTGANNSAIGNNALPVNTTASDNTSVGSNALRSTTIGGGNTAIGSAAMYGNIDGTENTAIGANALNSNSSGARNTAIGASALYRNTSGVGNIAIGKDCMVNNTTGSNLVAIGSYVMGGNTTGGNNTAVGFQTLGINSTGNGNTALGSSALYNSLTDYNTAIGLNVFGNQTTGSGNTGIGAFAGGNTTTGSSNVAVGNNALSNNTTGSSNVGIGVNTFVAVVTGNNNTGVGPSCLNQNTSGSYNVAVGSETLAENRTGNGNIALGEQAGRYSGAGGVTGATNCVFIGNRQQASGVSPTNEVVISGGQSEGLGSNTTVIGNGSTTQTKIWGQVAVGGNTPASATAAGVAGTITWDANYIYVCIATNTWKRMAISTW